MKNNILITVLLIISFLIGVYFAYPIRSFATALWDSHAIAGGMNGTAGVPLKVSSDGTLYIR